LQSPKPPQAQEYESAPSKPVPTVAAKIPLNTNSAAIVPQNTAGTAPDLLDFTEAPPSAPATDLFDQPQQNHQAHFGNHSQQLGMWAPPQQISQVHVPPQVAPQQQNQSATAVSIMSMFDTRNTGSVYGQSASTQSTFWAHPSTFQQQPSPYQHTSIQQQQQQQQQQMMMMMNFQQQQQQQQQYFNQHQHSMNSSTSVSWLIFRVGVIRCDW
jgi:hypothetical protein